MPQFSGNVKKDKNFTTNTTKSSQLETHTFQAYVISSQLETHTFQAYVIACGRQGKRMSSFPLSGHTLVIGDLQIRHELSLEGSQKRKSILPVPDHVG
jgi:hypothetical protein